MYREERIKVGKQKGGRISRGIKREEGENRGEEIERRRKYIGRKDDVSRKERIYETKREMIMRVSKEVREKGEERGEERGGGEGGKERGGGGGKGREGRERKKKRRRREENKEEEEEE